MKKHIYGIWVFFSLALVMAAAPVQASDFKIGYVNAARLIKEAPQALEASKKLEKEFAPRKKKLDASRAKIKKLEASMEKNALVMKEAERAKKEKQLINLQREFKRERAEVQEDYNVRRNEEIAKLEQEVYKAIIKHGEENKYDLIVRSDLILYANQKSDITDAILKRLGKK